MRAHPRTSVRIRTFNRNVSGSETLEKTRRKGKENRKNWWEQRFDRAPGTLIHWLKSQRRKTTWGNSGGEGKSRVGRRRLCGCLQQLHPFLCQLLEKQQPLSPLPPANTGETTTSLSSLSLSLILSYLCGVGSVRLEINPPPDPHRTWSDSGAPSTGSSSLLSARAPGAAHQPAIS